MNAILSLPNLAAWSLQIALVVAAGSLLRLKVPRAMLLWRQALLAACLLLPVLQPWRTLEVTGGTADSSISFVAGGAPNAPSYGSLGRLAGLAIAAGIGIRLMWLAAGYLRLRRMRAGSEPLDAPLPELCHRLGVEPSWHLSGRIDGPLTFGLFHPAILLPARFVSMPPDRQAAICAHELLHVRRRDWAFTIAEEAVRTLLWFHPAVWWLVSLIRLDREQVVDREVVRLTGARRPYLDALLDIAGAPDTAVLSPAPSFLRKRHLRERVALILKEVPMSKRRIAAASCAAGALALLAGALAVRTFPLHAAVTGSTVFRVAAVPPPDTATAAAASQDQGPYKVGDGVTAPQVIYKVQPRYTDEARTARVEGTVVLDVTVGSDGIPSDVVVKKSVDEGLDRNAVEAVRQWRFKPGAKDGVPVPVQAVIEINFRLMKDAKPEDAKPGPDGIVRPQLVYKVEPQYTEEARSAKIDGTVVLSAQINTEGRAEDISIVRGIDPGLDRNAIDAIGKWHFRPAMKDGQPVSFKATIEVNYRLQ